MPTSIVSQSHTSRQEMELISQSSRREIEQTINKARFSPNLPWTLYEDGHNPNSFERSTRRQTDGAEKASINQKPIG